ncbi:MAG: GTP cyclohydrolase [Planctomycetes bacterium]|nr:GTP cyclohydrolase [Planctomycetota bacterium]
MPIYVITIEYTKPMPEVEAATPGHRAYLKQLFDEGRIVASGPFVPRTGGMLLFRAANAAEVAVVIEADPFQRLGVARYDVREWSPTFGAERLA